MSSPTSNFKPLKGHCTCKSLTYEVLAPFLVTNCCHCTWCQRETGSAFALNSFVETEYFRITSPPSISPLKNDLPTASGRGQMLARCPKCFVVVFGDYAGDGTWWTVVRAGTLDDEAKERVKPDVHIWTSTKKEWVDLEGEKERGIKVLEEGYKPRDVWGKEALERVERLKRRIKEGEGSKI